MPSELQIMISDEDVDRRISTRRAAQRAQLEVSAEVDDLSYSNLV